MSGRPLGVVSGASGPLFGGLETHFSLFRVLERPNLSSVLCSLLRKKHRRLITRNQGIKGSRNKGPGPRAQGPGSRVQGPGSSVQGPGSRGQGPGARVQAGKIPRSLTTRKQGIEEPRARRDVRSTLNSPTQRRVRSSVASLLSLRSSEPPSRRLVARPDPPDLRGPGPARCHP